MQNLYGYQDKDIKRIANRCGMWRDNAVANYKKLKKDAGEKGSAKYWPEITIRPADLCRIFHVTEDYLFGYSNDPMKKVFTTWEELFKRLAKDYNLKSPEDVPKYAPPKSSVKYVYQTDPMLVNEVNRYRERINDFKFILRMGEAESHGLDANTLLYCIQRLEDRK